MELVANWGRDRCSSPPLFHDMQAERDWLWNFVFPAIEDQLRGPPAPGTDRPPPRQRRAPCRYGWAPATAPRWAAREPGSPEDIGNAPLTHGSQSSAKRRRPCVCCKEVWISIEPRPNQGSRRR
jgi:hypothetical protein